RYDLTAVGHLAVLEHIARGHRGRPLLTLVGEVGVRSQLAQPCVCPLLVDQRDYLGPQRSIGRRRNRRGWLRLYWRRGGLRCWGGSRLLCARFRLRLYRRGT